MANNILNEEHCESIFFGGLGASVATLSVLLLALKHRWRERGPLKPGEMNDTPGWIKRHSDYTQSVD